MRSTPATHRLTHDGTSTAGVAALNAAGSEPSTEQIDRAVATMKMLADPTRLRIVWALLHGEHSVSELADHLGVQATAVSQHLAKLRLAGLVRTRRQGNFVFYAADNDHIERLAAEALFHAGHHVEAPHGAHQDRSGRDPAV